MPAIVLDILHRFLPPPYISLEDDSTISIKGWSTDFDRIRPEYMVFHAATVNSIDQHLGPALDYAQRDPAAADEIGLHVAAQRPNIINHQQILTEGDVRRDFYENVESVYRLGFRYGPRPWPRSECGPTGHTTTNITVDYQLSWSSEDLQYEKAVMIGEMKRPGVIVPHEWLGPEHGGRIPGRNTRALQLQLRGYAYQYKCPQVFLYDSVHLLILQFRARTREDIRSRDCIIDCWIIPRAEEYCTFQYALYRLAWRGWVRLSATLDGGNRDERLELEVTIDRMDRRYEYWSGRPIWEVTPGRYEYVHPNGWQRQWMQNQQQNNGYWFWARPGSQDRVRDTGNCLL
ncbi:uncharacterized protein BDV17DRAFT_294089 [Aspergillus undulatus]|uniref:uncharacterized protein n=1 Tax=Aspergillus undulatus TaxID=1810928 RepID=UPI003CCCD7DA